MTNSQTPSGSEVASIAQVREGWLAAMNTDNLDGLVKPLAEGCWAFPPHEAAVHGVDAQRSWHQARIAQFATRITMSSDELIGAGDRVVDRTSYTIVLTPRSGGPAIQDSGTCFWIWERDADGSWKIARAIWNSAKPMPAAV